VLEALFTLFEDKKWDLLPNDVTLKEDPEAKFVMEGMFPGFVIKRSQVALQFANYKKYGTSAASVASSTSGEQVRALVASRVAARGGVDVIIARMFTRVASSRSWYSTGWGSCLTSSSHSGVMLSTMMCFDFG